MYTTKNFKTKTELVKAVSAGEHVTLFSPGLGSPKRDGIEYVEGPHFPEPHKWYAKVMLADGRVIKVS